jgi:hypothetical protein
VSGAKLISCLQPDRRVDIEVRGERQAAGTPAPTGSAGATSGSSGTTSGSGTLGSPGGSSSGASGASSSGSTK